MDEVCILVLLKDEGLKTIITTRKQLISDGFQRRIIFVADQRRICDGSAWKIKKHKLKNICVNAATDQRRICEVLISDGIY